MDTLRHTFMIKCVAFNNKKNRRKIDGIVFSLIAGASLNQHSLKKKVEMIAAFTVRADAQFPFRHLRKNAMPDTI